METDIYSVKGKVFFFFFHSLTATGAITAEPNPHSCHVLDIELKGKLPPSSLAGFNLPWKVFINYWINL